MGWARSRRIIISGAQGGVYSSLVQVPAELSLAPLAPTAFIFPVSSGFPRRIHRSVLLPFEKTALLSGIFTISLTTDILI
jgi:hypothetical protein